MATVTNRLIQALNNTRYYSTALALRWANRAERDICIKTGCLKNTDVLSTAASTRTLGFSGHRVLAVEYIPVTGIRRSLFRIVPRLLGRNRTEGADPKAYFQWGSKIGIDPLPNAAFALNVTIADYPAVEMAAASDNPEIPTDFEDLIILYGQFLAAVKDRKYQRAFAMYSLYRRQIFERGYSETNIPDSRAGLSIQEKNYGKVK